LAEVDEALWAWLEKRIYYAQGDFRDEHFYWRLRDLCYAVGGKNAIDDNYFLLLGDRPAFLWRNCPPP
jgi:hypothetical protein